MRLTCPNCGAQYEVDGSMIPDDGRDVQCSNCGHTWFQHPDGMAGEAQDASPETAVENLPEAEPPAAAESEEPQTTADTASDPEDLTAGAEGAPDRDDATVAEEVAPDPETAEETAAEETVPEPELEQDPQPEPEPDSEAPSEEGDDIVHPAPPRKEIDAAVLSILREEAEREVAARRSDEAALETQPDLGLAEVSASESRRVEEAARHAEPEHEGDPGEALPAAPGSRSDLLPDVDEINSTLRPAADHEDAASYPDPVEEGRQKRGFRMGFALVAVIAVVMALAYVFAPQISQQVPAAEGAISTYVGWADAARAGIDTAMERSVEGLSGLLAQGDEEAN